MAKFALETHAVCDPKRRNDTPFDLLAGLAGSFTGPPIFSPGIDRGEQQIGRAPEAQRGKIRFSMQMICIFFCKTLLFGAISCNFELPIIRPYLYLSGV